MNASLSATHLKVPRPVYAVRNGRGWGMAMKCTVMSLLPAASLSADTCGIVWMRVMPAGSPGEQVRRASAYDWRRATAVLFGGNNTRGSPMFTDQTWEYANNTWVLRVPAVRPSPRDGAAMAFDGDRGVCVLFGGGDNVGQFALPQNDTWEWNGTDWLLRVPSDQNARDRPPPLDSGMMVYDSHRRRTVLVGSSDRRGGTINPSTKTWEWDGNTWRAHNVAPPHRLEAAMVYDAARQVTLLFGGRNLEDSEMKGDTWAWNGAVWTRLAITGPEPREKHAMAFDERRGVATLTFGTASGLRQGDMFVDTWEWNGTTWTKYPNADNMGFGPRVWHNMWYDQAEQRLMSFGGYFVLPNQTGGTQPNPLNDLHEARPPGSWVDFNYAGTPEDGDFYRPFNTLAEGAANVAPGCTLNLKPGTSPERLTITTPVRLEAYASPVTIGLGP